MLAKIKQFEKNAKVLEPDHKQRKILVRDVEHYTNKFLEGLINSETYSPDLINQEIYNLLSIKDKPTYLKDILKILKHYVVDPGLNITAPGFLGYIPGGGLYSSALGDYIAAITNRFAGAYFVSPGAVRLENILIRWMAHLVGYSKMAGGNLSSGGSLANFIGIVTARQTFGLKSKDFSRSVIYTSSQVHHSVIKALRIAGLEEAIIRLVPADKNYALQPNILAQMIAKDKRKKLIPWLIVATFGTTNTGSIDPIEEISAISKKNKLWLHVDAAYGGFFLLCKSIHKQYSSIREADSITIDPHKGLFIPYGLGVILTKDSRHLLDTYYIDDIDYLPSVEENIEHSPSTLSPELSKHFRGLRMWLPLKLYGIKPFRAALNEKLLLTVYFYQELMKIKNIEVTCKPQLSVVAFRYCPPIGDANLFNALLAEKIKNKGEVFFSTTYLNHVLYLRMACLNFRTHLETIELSLIVLKQTIDELLKTV